MEYEFSEDTLGMVYETLSNIEVAISQSLDSTHQLVGLRLASHQEDGEEIKQYTGQKYSHC